ncbi:unnamed protein product [Rhizophagus irregularis]|nr:unnamed protein product [Rhizophagus irregularis]
MSRVRSHQTITNPPRYRKKPRKNYASAIQQLSANISRSELFEWGDSLNDQISTGYNREQQYNSPDAENIHLNSEYLDVPNIQPLENDNDNNDILVNQEEIQSLESNDDDDMVNQEESLENNDDDDDMVNQEENSNSLPSFKMYDGIESDLKSEFWHGELWQQSPLFGAEYCHYNHVTYYPGEFIKYIRYDTNSQPRIGHIFAIIKDDNDKLLIKIHSTFFYTELPRTYARSRQNSRQLWLTENQEIIELSQIINKVSVWLYDTQQPPLYEFIIKEILYYHNGRPLLRDISLRHHHSTLNVSSEQLERGFLMTIDNEQVWVSGGLGITTADLPQGNDLAGTLRHNATHGCRTCKASRDNLTDISFDIAKHGRYHHLTNIEFENIQRLPNMSQKHALASSLGLRLIPNPLDQLIRDRHISTPQDIFHCFAGKANRLLIATFRLLTNSGEDTFTRTWKFFEVPSCWSRQQNPITHLACYFMSDILRLTMIIPFILYRCLTTNLLKREVLTNMKERMNLQSYRHVINKIIKCWVQFSLTTRMVFSKTLTKVDYETIQKMLELECKMLLEVFPEQFSGLPNLHINRHIVAHAKTYGTALNTFVSVKEMVHRIHKGVVSHTNKKNVEFDLIKRDNTLQTLRYLLDGGQDIRFEHIIGQGIQNIVNDVALRPLLNSWYITSSLLPKIYDEDNIETNIITCIPEIMDINVRLKWNKYQRNQENFTIGKHLNGYLSNELANAYAEYYNDRGAMINSKVEFYNNISYVVKEDDCFVDVQLNVGDIVDVFEEGETEESYAIIKGIFTHERSRKLHAFITSTRRNTME